MLFLPDLMQLLFFLHCYIVCRGIQSSIKVTEQCVKIHGTGCTSAQKVQSGHSMMIMKRQNNVIGHGENTSGRKHSDLCYYAFPKTPTKHLSKCLKQVVWCQTMVTNEEKHQLYRRGHFSNMYNYRKVWGGGAVGVYV